MINHHTIAVKAPAGRIFRELLAWGESPWWPEETPMRYTRLTGGEVGVGTRYRQKVRLPFGPGWDVEVVSATEGREVSRKFLNGMFSGVERVYIIPGRDACEVHFMMDFEVVGTLNKAAWGLVFRKRHDESIRRILLALKNYLEGTSGTGVAEGSPDAPESDERRRFLKGIFSRRR